MFRPNRFRVYHFIYPVLDAVVSMYSWLAMEDQHEHYNNHGILANNPRTMWRSGPQSKRWDIGMECRRIKETRNAIYTFCHSHYILVFSLTKRRFENDTPEYNINISAMKRISMMTIRTTDDVILFIKI